MDLAPLFENTLVINLDSRPDRWAMSSHMMQVAGLQPQRFSATDGSKVDRRIIMQFRRANLGILKSHEVKEKWLQGSVGCLDSHIRALEFAQAERWPYVYLCEDDAATHPNMLDHVRQHLPDVPGNWWSLRIGWGMIERKQKITEHVHRILQMWCTTATVYSAEAIPALLEIYHKRERPSDVYHMQFDALGRSYAIMPFAVTQAAAGSDIGHWERQRTSNKNTLFGDYVTWRAT